MAMCQTASFAAWYIAIYSASTEERATEDCFFIFHEMTASPCKMVFAIEFGKCRERIPRAICVGKSSVQHLTPSVHGWRQRIGLLSVVSMYLSCCLLCIFYLPQSEYPATYVQELEARLLYMEQLFKQHAPHIEVFPPECSGLPSESAKSATSLVDTFVPATTPQVGMKQEELDDTLLMHDNDDEHAPLAEHFGQMALSSEGRLR